MYGESKGYSLTVLIITIAVILIITTTAVMSIKNVGKDRDVARFMSDLQEVKQYVIDYMAVDNTLPVKYDNNGLMISAELELISKFSGEGALSQISEEDVGGYYFVDLSKLGKIHLEDPNRGYIINEGTLNVYVTKPCLYQGINYYTLTPYLLGKDVVVNESTPFDINVMGNPITWSKKAEILVVIPNVKVGEAEGWNFKWLKGSRSAQDFKEETSGLKVNYFTYGDTIEWNENGVYTVYVENPERKALIRRVIVSKIDNIPPTIEYVSGEIIINDSETGVKDIRCKIKESINFPIDEETRNKYPEYYTKRDETYSDTAADMLENYLWGAENEKGDTVSDYLKKYNEYYEKFSQYNAILSNSGSNSGEIENATIILENLNKQYPQFAYGNRRFPNIEKNIVLYVEDMCENATVYSALNRDELVECEYFSGDVQTLTDSKVVINNGEVYTNSKDVSLYVQAVYAKYVFVTEEKVPAATWSPFESETLSFTLSDGDGEKTVYAFFKDANGKTAVAYDKISLDMTKPTDTAPTVSISGDKVSITVNQTDTKVVDGKETQSGLNNIFYGIKEVSDSAYNWYSKIGLIPKFQKGLEYSIVTRARDKAGNEQISKETKIKVE